MKSRYSGYEYLRFRKLDFKGIFNQQVDVTLSTVKNLLISNVIDDDTVYHDNTRRVSDLNSSEYPADFQESPQYQQPVKVETTQDFTPVQRTDVYNQKFDSYLEMPSHLGMGIQSGAKINIISNNDQIFDFTHHDLDFSSGFNTYNEYEDILNDVQNEGALLFNNNNYDSKPINLANLSSIGLTEEELMALMSSPQKAANKC